MKIKILLLITFLIIMIFLVIIIIMQKNNLTIESIWETYKIEQLEKKYPNPDDFCSAISKELGKCEEGKFRDRCYRPFCDEGLCPVQCLAY